MNNFSYFLFMFLLLLGFIYRLNIENLKIYSNYINVGTTNKEFSI